MCLQVLKLVFGQTEPDGWTDIRGSQNSYLDEIYSSILSFKQFPLDFPLTFQVNCRYSTVSDDCSYDPDVLMKLSSDLKKIN